MDLYEAVAGTYAVIGQEISDYGMKTIVQELSTYPESDVTQALARCRKELKRISLSEILDRMPHGYPGTEEAWALCVSSLNNEWVTVVMTEEMGEAMGAARNLASDHVGARMAFKEVYETAVKRSRAVGKKPHWFVSLGWDKAARELPILEAAQKGRVSFEYAMKMIPHKNQMPPDDLQLPQIKDMP